MGKTDNHVSIIRQKSSRTTWWLPFRKKKRWERVYDRILAKAQYHLEGMTPLPKKALSFVRRLQKRKEEALRFLREAHVPFDNNQAERDLRMVKDKENISGTFRDETFAQSFCIARSIVSTLTKHKKTCGTRCVFCWQAKR